MNIHRLQKSLTEIKQEEEEKKQRRERNKSILRVMLDYRLLRELLRIVDNENDLIVL